MRLVKAAAAAVFIAALGVPARADDAAVADLRAKQVAAARTITSFRMTMTMTMGQLIGNITFIKPQRVGMLITIGATTIEMRIIDGVTYSSMNGAAWVDRGSDLMKKAMANALEAMPQPGSYDVDVLPDRIEDGETVGVERVTLAPKAGEPARTAVCSYDKTTYYTNRCTMEVSPGQTMSLHISSYNDPGNVVPPPDGIVPPPSPSPPPA